MGRAGRSIALACGLTLAATAAACRARLEHPNVVLVTLDTTRADHMGAYGRTSAATPVFDRLAAGGLLFERAWTVTPLTTPAHASVMTGLYPAAHGVRNNGRFRLPEAAETLAERFREAGYATGAFVGGFPVGRMFGFAQGFDAFDDDFGTAPSGAPRSERTAGEVAQRARAWLEGRAHERRPFFLWVHFYDAHDPYDAPGPFGRRFVESPYDGEIAYVDHELGTVIDAVTRVSAPEDTVIAVAGDHGEMLGEHGEPTHGLFVYEAALRIPMVVRAPGRAKEGLRTASLASLVDVYPTLLGAAGLAAPSRLHGRDLLRAGATEAAQGDDPLATGPGRVVYAESFYGHEEYRWAPLVAVRRSAMKWIAAPRPERYDLERDPSEAENLAGRDAAKDRALGALLEQVARATSRAPLAAQAEGAVGDDLLSRLQSLGYVAGGGSGPAAGGDATAPGRDPKDAVDDYRAYLEGTRMIARRGGGGAVEVFERLVANDPGNPEFRLRLGMAYRAAGEPRRAEAAYRELIRRYPEFYLGYRRLTALLERQGRSDEAVALWTGLRARGGHYVGIEARLASALLGAGRPADALREADAGLGGSADDAELLVLAGRALEALGRVDEAAARYRRALEVAPGSRDAASRLSALERGGAAPPAVDSSGEPP